MGWFQKAAKREESWSVLQGEADGEQIIIKRADHFERDQGTRSSHPIRIGVAVPFDDPAELHLDGPYGQLEDRLEDASGGRAVLVLTLLFPSVREFILYAKESDFIAQYHQALQAEFPMLDVQMYGEVDKRWDVYFEYQER